MKLKVEPTNYRKAQILSLITEELTSRDGGIAKSSSSTVSDSDPCELLTLEKILHRMKELMYKSQWKCPLLSLLAMHLDCESHSMPSGSSLPFLTSPGEDAVSRLEDAGGGGGDELSMLSSPKA